MSQPNFQPEIAPDGMAFPEGPDTSDLTALPLAECGTFEIGKEITADVCPPHHLIALLEGKVRLLERTPDGAVQTRALMEAGDMWDKQAWETSNAVWVVAETARLGAMPATAVQQFPVMVACLERSRKKIQAVTSASSRTVKASPGIETPSEDYSILQDMLSVLKVSMSEHEDSAISDLEELASKLTQYGVRSQVVSLPWKQLSKLPTPWVLEDDTGALHCVTGLQKNAMLTRKAGKTTKLVLDRKPGKKHWHVLVTQPAEKTVPKAKAMANLSHEVPFTLGWYGRLLLKNSFVSGQMLIASFITQVFALGMPIFYMVIFDRVFGRQSLETLDIIAIGMTLVLVSDLVVRGIRSLVLTHLLIWVDRISTDTMLDMIFQIPLTRMSRDIIRQCNEMYQDLVKANQAVISLFVMSSLDAIFSCLMIVLLLSMHWQMALVSIASIVPLTLMAIITTPQIRKRSLSFMKSQRSTQVSLSETLENWETLHSYNALANAKERVRKLTYRMLGSHVWARFDSVSSNSISAFISGIGAMITLYYGAHVVLEGHISFGAYAAINLMSRNVVGSVQKFFSSLIQFQEMSGKLEKYQAVSAEMMQTIESKPALERARIVIPSVTGRIEIRNMRFQYTPDISKPNVLGPMSLTIEPGQKVILTGASGSGKTTLIRLMQGLYTPTEGAITLDGYRLNEFDPDTRNRLIGVALQRPAFLSGSVLENLTLENPNAPMKDVLDAVRLAQLDVLLDKLPRGLDAAVAPMAANLPPTLAARIALARVFINKPSVLMIDKAMDMLEPAVQAAIFSPMLQAYAQSTCILVTDYLPVHQQADRIIVMRDGMIVEDDTFANLIQARGYYYHLHVVDKTFSKT